MKHLWEHDHRYYCSEGSYHKDYADWQEFLEEWESADKDYNLLFRWDWDDEYDDEDNVIGMKLELFYMLQRKGYMLSRTVHNITKEDEPIIREFLLPHYQHIMALWQPFGEQEPA